MKNLRSLILALACGGALAACQDLNVPNPNSPALTEALATPLNVETTVGSGWKYWHSQSFDYDLRQGVSTWLTLALSGNADEVTYFGTGAGFITSALEPKQEMDHTGAGFWTNRTPWLNFHAAIATCKDVIETLDKGMKLGTISEDFPQGRNTDRARWLCTFVMGASHVYLAAEYDRAFIFEVGKVHELYSNAFNTPAEVHAHGLAMIEKAIDIAKASPDDATAATWINGVTYTRDEFVQVMYSYLAKMRVMNARNATESAQCASGVTTGCIDWNKVIADIDRGIPDNNFKPQSNSPLGARSQLCPVAGSLCGGAFVWQASREVEGTQNNYRILVSNSGSTGPRPHQRLLGPGDTTGAYQWWESQNITTRKDTIYASPDKRIHLTTQTSAGRYFARGGTAPSATLGPSVASRYVFNRWGNGNQYRDSLNMTLNRTEMDLLKAEAYIRTGQAALAVPLINKTRVGVRCIANVGGLPCTVATTEAGTYGGNLPAVDVNGPPQATAAQRASCVPKRIDGTCGNLFDALMWEKRMEMMGVEGQIAWTDWRRWGKFQKGTMIAMPIHSRELYTLGLAYYTFGGSTPGSVDAANTTYPKCYIQVFPTCS